MGGYAYWRGANYLMGHFILYSLKSQQLIRQEKPFADDKEANHHKAGNDLTRRGNTENCSYECRQNCRFGGGFNLRTPLSSAGGDTW